MNFVLCTFRRLVFTPLLLLACLSSSAQLNNTTAKWQFGYWAGLDFMTNPPSPLNNSQITTDEGCSSISDAAGNLLFYTNGITVWNANNAVMAGGTGLTANFSTTQAALIVKQPGNSNIYFLFTLDVASTPIAPTNGLKYSIIDMNLAAGLGSVTAANIPLSPICTERLAAVRHCNGTDIWVVNQNSTGDFEARLVTATGISTTNTTSSVPGASLTALIGIGQMKFSPNGKKLAMAVYEPIPPPGGYGFDLYDFDASTGSVSNRMVLLTDTFAYGIEFSPDGTKLYGARSQPLARLFQWDLCAGSPAAIVASVYSVATSASSSLQLAKNGKIYMAQLFTNYVGVIGNPNMAGAAMSFTDNALTLTTGSCTGGLPNFVSSGFGVLPPSLPFTSTITCLTASFTAPALTLNCSAVSYSLLGQLWDFGDPASGAANTTTLNNPAHVYPTTGSYTVSLIRYFSCGGGTDTLRQVVNITQPCVNVQSTGISCAALGSATVSASFGTGPYSYYWLPAGPASPVLGNAFPGTYTVQVTDLATATSFTIPVTLTANLVYSSTLSATPSLACAGATNGTAAIQVSGGSGNQNYYWYNGTTTLTTPSLSALGAGNYTVTVVDALSACSVTNTFVITQPSGSLTTAQSAQSLCVNSPVTFTATRSGDTPAYTYTWTGGPTTATWTTTQAVQGLYTYTVNSLDANNCSRTKTLQVNFLAPPNPQIALNTNTPCLGSTLLLSATGANAFTWAGPNNLNANGPTLTIANISPAASGLYTLTASNGPCSATALQSILVLPLPTPSIAATTACELRNITLSGWPGGATSYTWTGPQNFYSTQLNALLVMPTLANNGIYTLAVTNAGGCIGTATTSISVLPNPFVQAGGNRVCFGEPAQLVASGALSYTWTGPNGIAGYSPTLAIPSATAPQQVYTAIGMAANGCTASAQAYLYTNPLPTPALTVTPKVCLNQIVQLQASGGESYKWKGPYNFEATGQNLSFLAANMAAAGDYTVFAFDHLGCRGANSAPLQIEPLPQGLFSEKAPSHCVPFCTQLTFTPKNGPAVTSLRWTLAGASFTSNPLQHCFTTPGHHTLALQLSGANTCSNTITYAVDAFAPPLANFDFYPQNPMEGQDRVEFTGSAQGSPISNWNWALNDLPRFTAHTPTTSYLFQKPGTFVMALWVRDANGCADTVLKTIRVDADFAIYVPNAFTPNQDGKNEVFQAKGYGIKKYNLSIYNRWGQKIFETNNLYNGWDGTFLGQECQSDVYVWKLSATSEKGKEVKQTGHLTLYR